MKSQIDGSEATPWELIRLGEVSDGLERLASAYATDPSVSNTLSFGIGHLWIGHYGAAWNHFQDAIQRGPWTHDIYYGMAGTAKWCLNDYQAAVECWFSGLNPDYGDAGGAAVGNRLLLFAASALRPHAISKSEAISLLQEKSSDARLDSWPGPLVRLCLGESEVDFHLERAKYALPSREMLIAFYRSLLKSATGGLPEEALRSEMQRLSDATSPRWADLRAFTSLIWNEEFFIARHEAGS